MGDRHPSLVPGYGRRGLVGREADPADVVARVPASAEFTLVGLLIAMAVALSPRCIGYDPFGEITTVSHRFQPAGRFSAANSR